MKKKRKRKLIYIMSPARSGSTLLTYLLANVEGIATVGELKATEMGNVNEYICSCGEKITRCAFWTELEERLKSKGEDFSVGSMGTHFQDSSYLSNKLLRAATRGWFFERLRDFGLAIIPRAKEVLAEVLKRNDKVIEEICEIQNCEVFLDDSKSPSRLKHMCNSGLWDIYIISLHRDGRGVVTSYMKTTSYSVEKAASEWLHICKEIEATKKELYGEKIHSISYEDICRNPAYEIGKVCDFVGISKQAFTAKNSLNQNDRHIIGNQMRLNQITSISLDERWKELLEGADMEYFEKIAGPTNKALGY
ncbi:sulfotransferase [Pseudomonadales bacterium]|jgi:hypothetical protein|nr:sulfotransferase [Pseudomonadales bacterium]MDB2449492.1 sulfotransferase [Pseudomonadales bacterium]MDC1083175.1 sulfotransferase [Pseudomonadales bacterium]